MRLIFSFLTVFALSVTPALAHFQELLPSNDVLSEGGTVTLDAVFTHPMEGGPAIADSIPC